MSAALFVNHCFTGLSSSQEGGCCYFQGLWGGAGVLS